jgi:hypothetical protein
MGTTIKNVPTSKRHKSKSLKSQACGRAGKMIKSDSMVLPFHHLVAA